METEEKRKIESDEIDLIALFQKLWAGRKTILKFLLIFGIIGLFIAIFSPKEYTATTVMVPASSEKGKVGGSLGGLAAIAGINLSGNSSEAIPPALYPKVIGSVPFKNEILETSLNIVGVEGTVSFKEYYDEIYSPGLFGLLKKYTIDLPGLILNSLRTQKEEKGRNVAGELLFISKKEKKIYDLLDEKLSLKVNEKEGFVTLKANMPEALASAQLARTAQKLLQQYIIEVKSKKAKEQLKFIEERYAEKKEEFCESELALATFEDRNRNVATATAMTKHKHLQAEYNLVYNVYMELAKQIEQQKIQVKQDTPVFTIIEPVSVPVEKSKPRRLMILAIWLFLGFVIGVGVVFGKEFVGKIRESRL